MTGPEHYREAERLLAHTEYSVPVRYGAGAECARQQLAAAQVHATLANTAAAALSDGTSADRMAWLAAVSAQENPE